MKIHYKPPNSFEELISTYKSCFISGNLSDYAIRQYYDLFSESMILAYDELSPIGFCIGGVTTGKIREGWILSLAVNNNYRKLGIANNLIKETLQSLHHSKCNHTLLTVTDNNLPARKLFNKVGFEEIGSHINYYHDKQTKIVCKYTY